MSGVVYGGLDGKGLMEFFCSCALFLGAECMDGWLFLCMVMIFQC